MKVNDVLKSLRQAKGLTQSEAANEFGVSLSSYQKYEREKNCITPSLEVLERIAEYYNVTIDYLLGRSPDEDNIINLLSAEYNLTELEKDIVQNYLSLPDNIRHELLKYLKGMVAVAEEEAKASDNTDVKR